MTRTRRLQYENFTFKQLMELDACTRCGECITWCPTYAEKETEAITPLGKIEQMRRFATREYGVWARLFGPRTISDESLTIHSEGAYDCTLCARCHEVCPVNIDTRPLWIAMREQLVVAGVLSGADGPNARSCGRHAQQPWGNRTRTVRPGRPIWIGSRRCLRPVSRRIWSTSWAVCRRSSPWPTRYPRAWRRYWIRLASLLPLWASEEWCCGFPLIIAGMGSEVEETVRHNVQAVRHSGASRLVVTCPSCYHTWKDTYP